MSWFFLVIAGLGLGLVFRVPAVVALGTCLFLASVASDLLHDASWGKALLSGFLRLTVLQGAYLAGLLVRRLLPNRSDSLPPPL